MTDDDLFNCFMMFKSATGASPEECYQFAKDIMELRKQKEKDDEEDIGITAVMPKRTRKR